MTPAGGQAGWSGSRAVATTAAMLVGAWMSVQFWPHWLELRGHRSSRLEPPASVSAIQPSASLPADVRESIAGTDASISSVPLPLVLVATTPAGSLADSTAALGTDPKNPQVYAGGAVLSNGARIEEIAADHVVLSFKGERTVLARASGEAGRHDASPAGASALRVGGSPIAGSSAAPAGSSRQDLSEFIRARAVFDDGQLRGLAVLPGSNTVAFDALGVLPGDVIRSIAGSPVESESDWQDIEDALVSGGSIVVGIERNGSQLSVSMDGARLAAGPPPA